MGMHCKVCGRSDRKIIKGMCPRHKSQFEEFGYNLDDNPIDEYDMNEIVLHKDYAEIKLYDNLFNELSLSLYDNFGIDFASFVFILLTSKFLYL